MSRLCTNITSKAVCNEDDVPFSLVLLVCISSFHSPKAVGEGDIIRETYAHRIGFSPQKDQIFAYISCMKLDCGLLEFIIYVDTCYVRAITCSQDAGSSNVFWKESLGP
jgi:hypothetical protein